MTDAQTAPETGSVLQLKVRLLGISPMIWRRILVPEAMTLHELHGVLQVAMGWEAIRLLTSAVSGCRSGTVFVEATVTGRRFPKKQRRRWSKASGLLMLRIGPRAPHGTLKARFRSRTPHPARGKGRG